RAWLGVTTADGELIQRSLMLAMRCDRGQSLSDGTPSVRVAVALISSLVGSGGVNEVMRHADVVRAAGDHLVNPWWGAATVMKGT
ncbi:LuxR family transcriptional regulator, partial [Mycobacterium sp. ITM-2017-0098]